MKASIVILNWNGGAEDCLEAVASAMAQDHPNKEIIFVDNASTDGSLEAVKSKYPTLNYIQTGSNLGCPGGRNVGASAATGDVIFFLENDGAWASNDVVSGVIGQFNVHPEIGALYTRVEGYKSRQPDAPIDKTVSADTQDGIYLTSSFRGGASAIRLDLFNKIGQFPNDFIRQYEERYVSLFVYQLGYVVAYWPEKILLHRGSDYQGKSASVIKFNCINELKTIRRAYPAFIWPVIFALKAGLWGIRLLKCHQTQLISEVWQSLAANSVKLAPLGRITFAKLYKIQAIRYGKINITMQSDASQNK